MNTLIFLGIAAVVIGCTYAVPALLRHYRNRKPDNKDLFQK